MGEARRRREREASLDSAFRLGGVVAVREMLVPGEPERCPVCSGTGSTGPVSLDRPDGARVRCGLCVGQGGIRRTKPTGDFAVDQDRFVDKIEPVTNPRSYRR